MLLGRYEVIRKLGVGGFGEVLLARAIGAEGFERVVALKRLKGDLARKQGSLQGIINEARIGGLLNHPNIVQVLEFVQLGPDYLLIMEYVDGIALQELLDLDRNRTPHLLTPGLALDIAIQACEGLHYAHAARSVGGKPLKLIHRDIKPSNLMITRTGTLKIMDFGVARSATNLGQSSTGSIKGTLRYLSPEQAEGSREIGHASDVFSLALVLCEMIVGHAVYEADQEHLVLLRALQARTGDALKEAETAAPGIGPILSRALAPRPEERYRTAEELAQALRALKAWFPVEYGLPALVERALIERKRNESEDDLSTETSFSVKLRQRGLDRPRTGWELLVPPDSSSAPIPMPPDPSGTPIPAPPDEEATEPPMAASPPAPPRPPVQASRPSAPSPARSELPPPTQVQTSDFNTARSWEWEWHITNLPPRSELEDPGSEEISFDGIVIEDFLPPDQAGGNQGEPMLVRIDLQSPLSREETAAINRAYREPASPLPGAMFISPAAESASFDDSGVWATATLTALQMQALEAAQPASIRASSPLVSTTPAMVALPDPAEVATERMQLSLPPRRTEGLGSNGAEQGHSEGVTASRGHTDAGTRSRGHTDAGVNGRGHTETGVLPPPSTPAPGYRAGAVRTPDRTRTRAPTAPDEVLIPVAVPGSTLVQTPEWPVGQFVVGFFLGMLLLGLGFVLGLQYGHRAAEAPTAQERPSTVQLMGSSSEVRPEPAIVPTTTAPTGPLPLEARH